MRTYLLSTFFVVVVFVGVAHSPRIVAQEGVFQAQVETFEDMELSADFDIDAFVIPRGMAKQEFEHKLSLFQRVMAPLAGPLLWVYVNVVYAYRHVCGVVSSYYNPLKSYIASLIVRYGNKKNHEGVASEEQ